MKKAINISLPDTVAIHLLSNDNSIMFLFFFGESLGNSSESFTVSGCNPAAIPAITAPMETGPQLQ